MTDVRLSDEHEALVETGRRIVERAPTTPPEVGGGPVTDEAAWRALVETGLVSLGVPEVHGGGGATALEVALVTEQLARGPLSVPHLGTVLALDALARGAASGSRTDPLDDVLGGLVAGASSGYVLSADLRRAAASGLAVDAAPGALVVGVDATDERSGPAPVVVGSAGAAVPGVDLTRRLAETGPTGGTPLAHLDDDQRRRHLAFGLAVVCADLLGAMHAALDGAVAHARDRVQFGRPVGSFQAVQHLCAEALVSVEAARSITWHAAWAVEAETPSTALDAARVAKAYCSEVALEVVEAAVQVWGGVGITWECPVHLHQRRVLLSRRLLGDDHHHLGVVAHSLLAAGERVG